MKVSKFSLARIALYGAAGVASSELVYRGITGTGDWVTVATSAVILGSASAGLWATYCIRKMVLRYCALVQNAAKGDLEGRLVGVGEEGELGAMGRHINHLLDTTDAFVREAMASMDKVSKGEFYRRIIERGMDGTYRQSAGVINGMTESLDRQMNSNKKVAEDFRGTMEGAMSNAADLSSAAKENASSMEEASKSTADMISQVLNTMRDVSGNVQVVASAAEEMTASIQEIRSRMSRASDVTADAVKLAQETDEVTASLEEATQQIGTVIDLIETIADQTNLLALNATIEAARAGEAGKGFAVVAQEVKSLSEQTSKATDEIRKHVGSVRNVAGQAVSSIRQIGQSIEEINKIAAEVNGAVGEQSAATEEISKAAQQSASGVGSVTEAMDNVSVMANDTTKKAAETLNATSQMYETARTTSEQVDAFMKRVGLN